MIARWLILFGALLACATGCAGIATHSFLPSPERYADADGILVELDETGIETDRSDRIVGITAGVVITGATPLAIWKPWLADRTSPACTGGLPATRWKQVEPRREPPTSATFSVAIRFEEEDDAAPRPAGAGTPRETGASTLNPLHRYLPLDVTSKALDILFVRGRQATCIRVPFTGAEHDSSTGWTPSARWGVGASLRAPVIQTGPRLTAGTLSATFAAWSGPFRVWIEPGLTTALDGVSLSGHAEWAFLHRGRLALAVSTGYSVHSIGTLMRVVHGPEVALRFKWTMPEWVGIPSFRGATQPGAFELFVPVDYGFSSDGDGVKPGPSFGLGIAVQLL